jgi:hypothetical protein
VLVVWRTIFWSRTGGGAGSPSSESAKAQSWRPGHRKRSASVTNSTIQSFEINLAV